jgi:hypothetical protein
LEVESERLTKMRKWGRRSSRFCSIRKAGRGSLVEVLMPCFFIKWRSSSSVVRSKEESWNGLEVEEEGKTVSVRWSGEVGKDETNIRDLG